MTQRYPVPPPAGSYVRSDNTAKAVSYVGGAFGDDVDVATANATLDYAPRTQAAKAALVVPANTLVEDIARPRGWIAPGQPAGAKPAAPVVTSISPTTGPQTSLPLLVTITGTGFTPWSTVLTGGMPTPDPAARYVSATRMTVPIWAAAPGTVSVAVEDHNVLSNADKLFTVT